MTSGPVMVHAQEQAPNKRQDDFDMAKLKKSLKQQQRSSLISKHKVAKLTPDEIRSLNHSASVSKSGSIRSIDSHSVHRLASSTPPLTPDQPSSQQSQAHVQRRRSSADLATPPVSPDHDRRGSNVNTRYIHAPKPISHAQAIQLANASTHARPPSATSYRGIATYRGPEITRTGSLTMLHTPSQQIVSNPLSQFSRPRQSTLTSSPQKTSPEQRVAEDNVLSLVPSKQQHQPLGAMSRDPSRDHSPIRPSDSPVSIEDGKVPKLVNAEPAASGEVPVVRVTPKAKPDDYQDEGSEVTKKQKLNWRKTFAGSTEPESEIAPLRKEHRRRSFMSPKQGHCLHAVAYADTKAGEPPQLRSTLKDELPSAKTAEYKKDEQKQATCESPYDQHPAVRPLSMDAERSIVTVSDTSSSKKGKEREDAPGTESVSDGTSLSSSMPSYQRCSCCGRLGKPGGSGSELSPVLENEHLRTNLTLEAERTSPSGRRRSSSISSQPRKFVPIIPMEVGSETRQARIEPMKEPAPSATASNPPTPRGLTVNRLGDVIGPSSTPLAIMPKSREKPRVVRFASLHMKNEGHAEQDKQQQNVKQKLAPQPQLHRFGSLYGMRNNTQQQQQHQQSPQQQSAYSARQQSEGAYQAQQQRQSFSQASGYHPLRSSVSAYDNNASSTPSTPTANTCPQASLNASMDAFEKPLGDSPASSRNKLPDSPGQAVSDDGAEPMVDLSSFDGSFVHSSLSRSATMMRNVSSPQTSDGLGPTNSVRSGNEANIGKTMTPAATSSAPALIRLPTSPSGKTNFSRPLTPQQPTKIDTSMPSYNYMSTVSAPPMTGATDSRSLASSITSTPAPIDTQVADATAITSHRSATIVKLIPSAPTTATSSATNLSSKGPLRLGDWVLPESPPTQSANGSAHASERGSVSSGKKTVAV